LNKNEIKYLDVQNESTGFAFRLQMNGNAIEMILTGEDNIYRSSQKNRSPRHNLTGLDWPLF